MDAYRDDEAKDWAVRQLTTPALLAAATCPPAARVAATPAEERLRLLKSLSGTPAPPATKAQAPEQQQ